MGITLALAAYGIYAFVTRGLWKYLTLQQPFFFLDLEHGYLLFALDCLAIVMLFAVAVHLFNAIILIRQTRT